MTIHITNAQSIGSLIVEGKHKPFRALACPLGSISREVDFAGFFAEKNCSEWIWHGPLLGGIPCG